MGASRAMAAGNDAIYLNPAALGATRQYTAALDYVHDTGPGFGGDSIIVSLADSISNARFPGGMSYRYVSLQTPEGAQKGSLTDIAVGLQLSSAFTIGTRVSYQTTGDSKQFTGDLGGLLSFGSLNLSVVGFNLIKVDTPSGARGLSAGAALSDGVNYRLGGDVRWEWGDNSSSVQSYALGGEYLLADTVPLRAGYNWDNVRQTRFLSFGTGIYISSFGADVSFRRDIHSRENMFVFSIKLFGGH